MGVLPPATVLKPIVWNRETALLLIAELQPEMWTRGFHVALAGGVLNHGFSRKDLDLVFLPMGGDQAGTNAAALVEYLASRWGTATPIVDPTYDTQNTVYRYKLKFSERLPRIDAFIL